MLWGFEYLPQPDGPDPTDPDFVFGVLIALIVSLLISLPVWWVVLTSDG
jgi:hypothetical protein